MKSPAPVRLAGCVFLVGLLAALPLAAQVTESPYTVEPGRLRVEMDGIRLSMDRADAAGNKYSAMAIASTIVTAGLTSSVDLQAGFDLFLREKFDIRGRSDSRSGLGDVSFRAKWTFWKNESLGAAAAVIPYVKLATGTGGVGSEGTEGGVIVPWSIGVGGGITAGAMLRCDVVRNDADNGFDSNWQLTGLVERRLLENLGVYGELMVSASSAGFSEWAGNVGVGAFWQVTKRLQLDVQLIRGLNDRATDWTHVARVNWDW